MPSKESAAAASEELIPGVPGVEPPTVAEPTEPRAPLPPKPDQSAPAVGDRCRSEWAGAAVGAGRLLSDDRAGSPGAGDRSLADGGRAGSDAHS